MKKLIKFHWPVIILFFYFIFLYRDFFFGGLIPAPYDALVGSYLPWLDYKWGNIVGVPVKNAMLSDSFSYFFVFKHLSSSLFFDGVVPFWNRYILSGTPLLSTYHSNVFLPFNILFLLPKYYGWSLFVFLSSLLSAISFYVFLSSHVKSKLGRIIGSLVFSLGGPMTTWVEFGTAVWSMTFIPLMLFSIDKYIEKSKNIYLFLLSLFTLLLILSGNVQIDIYSGIVVFLYTLFVYSSKGTNRLNHIFKIMFFYVLGVGVSCIQLVPTYFLYKSSIRPEFTPVSFNYGLIDLFHLIRLWVADFFGHPSTHNEFGPYYYHEYVNFLGSISIPLILAVIIKKTNHKVISFFKYIFVISLLLSVHHPFSQLIFSMKLPLLTYSSASRIFFIVVLSGAVLIGSALDHVYDLKFRNNISFLSIITIVITITALLFVDKEYQNISFRNSIIPLAFLIICWFSFYKLNPKLIVLFVFLVFSFDLGRYFNKYNPFAPEKYISPMTPSLEYLASQSGLFRIARGKGIVLPPNTWAAYSMESIEGVEPMQLLSYNRFFHIVANQNYFNSVSPYLELEDFRPQFIDSLNVKYWLIKKEDDRQKWSVIRKKINELELPLVFSDQKTEIYENKNYLQRAYFASDYKQYNNDQDLADILESPNFDPKKTILIPSYYRDLQKNIVIGNVNSLIYSGNRVTIITSSPGNSILILSDSYDAGWNVTIDGNRGETIKANGALRAVYLEPGNHTVVWTYIPPGIEIGIALSLLSLTTLAFSLFYLRSRNNLPAENTK